MKKIIPNRASFTGRPINAEERGKLESEFPDIEGREEFFDFLENFPVVGQEFEISEEQDASEFGGEFEIMSPSGILDEALNFFPGIAAIKQNFIPFGDCLNGSGNPYFIRFEDEKWVLIRINHDEIDEEEELTSDAVEKVIDLEQLLQIP